MTLLVAASATAATVQLSTQLAARPTETVYTSRCAVEPPGPVPKECLAPVELPTAILRLPEYRDVLGSQERALLLTAPLVRPLRAQGLIKRQHIDRLLSPPIAQGRVLITLPVDAKATPALMPGDLVDVRRSIGGAPVELLFASARIVAVNGQLATETPLRPERVSFLCTREEAIRALASRNVVSLQVRSAPAVSRLTRRTS